LIFILLFIAACFLAYSNGANDNFKGVATLFGSGTTNYKIAITWATVTTFAGSMAAIFIAETLVKNFSGKGLVPDNLIQDPIFAISIALGAAITVLLATKIGIPISTTHALVGALFGSGVMAIGAEFNFEKLGKAFMFPLILSPLIAAVFSMLVYIIFRHFRELLGVTKKSCICVVESQKLPISSATNSVLQMNPSIKLTNCKNGCEQSYAGKLFGISAQKVLDIGHYISAGIVSFARGLNDTPKIVGLLIIINAIDIKWGMIAVAITMAIGGLLSAKKVGVTMSKKITPMNSGQGFTANIITGLLVTTASIHGLPVSTTHVSVGSIFGIGTVTNMANRKMVSKILLSWVLTLPIAAIISGLIFILLQSIL
jgi:PiT family inorganic phosphate transporter